MTPGPQLPPRTVITCPVAGHNAVPQKGPPPFDANFAKTSLPTDMDGLLGFARGTNRFEVPVSPPPPAAPPPGVTGIGQALSERLQQAREQLGIKRPDKKDGG